MIRWITSIFKKKRYTLGCDIVEIARIQSLKDSVIDSLFNQVEIDYFNTFKKPSEHIAGFFCAKEAIVKALGTGINKDVTWKDISIIHDPLGKPIVCPECRLFSIFDITHIDVSISHSKQSAIATALVLFR